MSDVVAFTSTRWGAAAAREHAWLREMARTRRVFAVEPPLVGAHGPAFLEELRGADGLVTCVPHLPSGLAGGDALRVIASLVDSLVARRGIDAEVLWVQRASDLEVARSVAAQVVVWDCCEATGEPGGLEARRAERALLSRADVVLVPTHAAAESRRRAHPHVHVMPATLDVARHAPSDARDPVDPLDQAGIHGPRIGLAAPLDAQLDVALLAHVADALPEMQLIALGTPAGIDPRVLPCRPNLRWLGEKSHDELPRYVAGWDVAIAPLRGGAELRAAPAEPRLALEVMAAGRPVVGTPTRDLVALAATSPLARTADRSGFVAAIEAALREPVAAHAGWAGALREELGAEVGFARVESWIAAALERARERQRAGALARSSA